MKKKIIRIIALLIIVAVGFANFYQEGLYMHRIAHASHGGRLEIEFQGDDLDGPIFEVYNMLPGDCETRTITIKNKSNDPLQVFVKSGNEQDDDNLASQIDWEIKKGPTVILHSLLSEFYADNDGVSLGNFPGDSEAEVTFKACFKLDAGNEFQGTETRFKLLFNNSKGQSTELPNECQHLEGKIKKFIIGNGGNQHLFGSSDRDFIDGGGGNDHIFGFSADDCLVGGTGNDKIEAGSGNDTVLGNAGNDDLRGESGKDFLDGGPNHDSLHGDSGQDTCVNGENNHSCEL